MPIKNSSPFVLEVDNLVKDEGEDAAGDGESKSLLIIFYLAPLGSNGFIFHILKFFH